jgi:hypothetical protein
MSCGSHEARQTVPGLLRVGSDGRMLVHQDGTPFLWIGDTAWSLFSRSRREDTESDRAADRYFENRAAKGFTVIQTHILTNLVRGPIDAPNVYGHVPFEDGDFTRPRTIPGPANDYWDHADYLIRSAAGRGLYLAIIAAWTNSFQSDDHPMVANPEVAYRYGHFLGDRYRENTHIIWILGGDPKRERMADNPLRLSMTRALAEGIADGVNGEDDFDGKADYTTSLMSYHPGGGNRSSSTFLHEEPWLDFNMIQTTTRHRFRNYQTVAADYARSPAKPTFDCEVAYEYSLSLSKGEREGAPASRISPWEVRRAAYWNLFAGGCGHTYGHRSFIGWVISDEEPLRYGADKPWFESLDAPGARQMGYVRRLIESRPVLGRIPDQSLVVGDAGEFEERVQATRAQDGTYAFIYVTNGRTFTIDLSRLSGKQVRAWWFDPRNGSACDALGRPAERAFAEYPADAPQTFTPPSSGEDNDWVLILDDVSSEYGVPGA